MYISEVQCNILLLDFYARVLSYQSIEFYIMKLRGIIPLQIRSEFYAISQCVDTSLSDHISCNAYGCKCIISAYMSVQAQSLQPGSDRVKLIIIIKAYVSCIYLRAKIKLEQPLRLNILQNICGSKSMENHLHPIYNSRNLFSGETLSSYLL